MKLRPLILLLAPLLLTAGTSRYVDAPELQTKDRAAINVNFTDIDTTVDTLSSKTDKFIRNIGFVNVKDKGAKCDGVTDDYNAIQNALTNNDHVMLPPNSTCIVGTGLLLKSNQWLEGNWGSLLKASPSFSTINVDTTLIFNTDTSGGNSNIKVTNLSFDGAGRAGRLIYFVKVNGLSICNNKTFSPLTAGAHIDVRGSTDVFIMDNFMDGVTGNGLGINVLDGSNNITVSGNIGKNLYDSLLSVGSGGVSVNRLVADHNIMYETVTGFGIDIFGLADDVILSNNIINGANLQGIRLQASGPAYPSDVQIIGNSIINSSDMGIDVEASTFSSRVQISDNYLSGNTQAIGIYRGDQVKISGNMISGNSSTAMEISVGTTTRVAINGNHIQDNGGYGIRIVDGDSINVSDNFISSGSYTAIVGVGVKNCIFSCNVIKNYGRLSDATYKHGIQIIDGSIITSSIDNIIVSNRIFDDQPGKTQHTGIVLGGTSDYNIIVGNSVRGNNSGAYSLVGANNVAGNNIP